MRSSGTPETGKVTRWLRAYRTGEESEIPQWFFDEVRRIADYLVKSPLFDGDDVAVTVLNRLVKMKENGQLQQLPTRYVRARGLLMKVVKGKVCDLRGFWGAIRRGGQCAQSPYIDAVPGRELPPDALFELRERWEQFGRFLQSSDDRPARVARFRVEGQSLQAIADLIGCSRTTVHRDTQQLEQDWPEFFS